MPKEKKPSVGDIEKLRKVLDNPANPNVTHILSKNDAAIDSVRRRLTHRQPVYRTLPVQAPSRISLSLQPTVTIRTRLKQATMSPPSVTVAPLPEFEPVSVASTAPAEEIPVFTPVTEAEPLFDDVDLIEIEKVDTTVPEFTTVTTPGPPTIAETELPHWQPVTEAPTFEPAIPEEPAEEVPEFTQLTPEPPEEIHEESTAWKPVETETPPLTRQQQRAQQKEEKRKEKLERKQARVEARRKKQEAKQQQRLEREQEQRDAEQKKQEVLGTASEPIAEPQPPEEPSLEPTPSVEQPPEVKVDLSVFKGIPSIDERVGDLLYRNGYFSLDDLHKATVDDLTHIRGIKRKLAKKIKKEVEQQPVSKPDEEFIIYNKRTRPKKGRVPHEDATEWETFSVNNEETASSTPATYRKYTLYKRERRKGGKKTTVHFFSKEKPAVGTPVPMPKGYEIAVHKKTKVPYLKKKK